MRQVPLVCLLALGLVLSGCASKSETESDPTSTTSGPDTRSVPTSTSRSSEAKTSAPSSGTTSAPPTTSGTTTGSESNETTDPDAPKPDPVVVSGTTMRLVIFCEDSVHEVSGVDGWHYLLEADEVLVAGQAYVVFEIDGELAAAEQPVEGTTPAGVTGVKACTPTEAQGQSIDYTVTFTAP